MLIKFVPFMLHRSASDVGAYYDEVSMFVAQEADGCVSQLSGKGPNNVAWSDLGLSACLAVT